MPRYKVIAIKPEAVPPNWEPEKGKPVRPPANTGIEWIVRTVHEEDAEGTVVVECEVRPPYNPDTHQMGPPHLR